MNVLAPFLLVAALAIHSAHAAAPQAPKAIIDQIDRLTLLLKDSQAVGYPDATMVQKVRLGPQREGAIVVFTVEGFGGGNNHSQYLALFEIDDQDKAKPYYSLLDFVRIGGKGWRAVEKLQARVAPAPTRGDMVIDLDALEVGPQDAPQFPQQEGRHPVVGARQPDHGTHASAKMISKLLRKG